MSAAPNAPSGQGGHAPPSAVHRLVSASLNQPLLVLLFAVVVALAGIWSFSQLPVDAYPDISPPVVDIITQWPGHAAEEVERLITVPLENEMNGVERLRVERSISLFGLSDISLTFTDKTDPYFARQRVFERLPSASLPDGVDPEVEPLVVPSGLIYRYVLDSPDRSAMELKIINDWVLEKAYRGVPGVAALSGLGGETMEYHVVIDPIRLAGAGLGIADVVAALGANNSNAGGGFYTEGGQFYYVRGLGRLETLDDIAKVVLKVDNGRPVTVRDVGRVEIGHAPRLGQFGFNERDDAVEGVILMRVGEQAQTLLQRVEAKTNELNATVLPKDVKIHPFYDRRDLISLTTRTVEDNLLRGILLVIVILIFFLYDIRSGLIVAATIPLSLLFAFVVLDLRGIPANLLSIGAIDFGILVDGGVVMVENIYRQLALRHGTTYSIKAVIAAAAAEVDRPIVYAIAVIVAGFLPIYVLSGPSGRLFTPMADTMIYALVGSLLLTLTLLPVLCMRLLRGGVRERKNPVFDRVRDWYAVTLDWSLRHGRLVVGGSIALAAAALALTFTIGAEFMPHLDEGSLWVRATMPYTISLEESQKIVPQIRAILRSFPEVTDVGSEHGRPDDGTDADRLLQRRVLRRPQAVRGVEGPVSQEGGADRGDRQEALELPGHHVQLHAAGGGQPQRGGDRPEELPGREAVRRRPRHAPVPRRADQARAGRRARHPRRDAGAGAGAAQPDGPRRQGQARPLRAERRRRQRPGGSGRGRRGRHPGGAGRAPFRPRRAAVAGVSRDAGGDREHPAAHARR